MLVGRGWRRVGCLVAAVVLPVGLGALTASPAQAVPAAQVGWISAELAASYGLPEATIVVDATATTGDVTIGWDSSYNAPSVTFADVAGGSGPGFGSVPDGCAAVTAGVVCPLDAVVASMGSGGDGVIQSGICMTALIADLGEGANRFVDGSSCADQQFAVYSGSGRDDLEFLSNATAGTYVDSGGGDDLLVGSSGPDEIHAGDGTDEILGLGGNDTILGDGGNDTIYGGPGADKQNGGAGDDFLSSESSGSWDGGKIDTGADDVRGGPGKDTVNLTYDVNAATISLDNNVNDAVGGTGGDNYHSDIERVLGSSGDDRLVGSSRPEELTGNYGNDRISGGGGNDTLYGGAESDKVDGGPGKDRVFGDTSSCCTNNGNDVITVADGVRDSVNCGGGADAVLADRVDIVAQDSLQRCERVRRKR